MIVVGDEMAGARRSPDAADAAPAGLSYFTGLRARSMTLPRFAGFGSRIYRRSL